jgi:hypothetical protein
MSGHLCIVDDFYIHNGMASIMFTQCIIVTVRSPGNMLFSRMSPNLPDQNLISTYSCCLLCCRHTKLRQTSMQNHNLAVYCHSHCCVQHVFHNTMQYVAKLKATTHSNAWWSLWNHSVQFPLIVLLIISRTTKLNGSVSACCVFVSCSIRTWLLCTNNTNSQYNLPSHKMHHTLRPEGLLLNHTLSQMFVYTVQRIYTAENG